MVSRKLGKALGTSGNAHSYSQKKLRPESGTNPGLRSLLFLRVLTHLQQRVRSSELHVMFTDGRKHRPHTRKVEKFTNPLTDIDEFQLTA
jgi:hypothetical protein